MIKRGTESMLKIFNKNKEKKPIEKLRDHFSDRFLKTVELVQAEILKEEDIKLFIENEPTVNYVINDLKEKEKNEKHKKAYNAIVKRDSLLINEQIEKVKQERAVHYNEFSKIMLTDPVDASAAAEKQTQLNFISNNIRACDILLTDLQKCFNTNFKKAIGRPKTEEEKPIFELAKQLKEVDEDGLTLDERIMALTKQLNQDKKKYLVEYIKQMIEAEKAIQIINVAEGGDAY